MNCGVTIMLKRKFLTIGVTLVMFAGLVSATERDSEAAKAAQALIQAYGYQCNTITHFSRSAWDGSFRVTCDRRYVYRIKDVAGRYVVEVL